MSRRTLTRLGGVTGAALLVTAFAAAPASAHVTITPTGGTAAGSYTVLSVAFGHGCEGSPTRQLAIQMPEQVNAVTPTLAAGWTVEKQMEQLAEPIEDSHGNEVTERVAQVVYTADRPVLDGYRAALELALQLPDAEGEELVFPVVQRCAQGETGWVETAAEGQDADSLERPAPVVEITAAEEGDGHSEEDEAAGATEAPDASGSEDSATTTGASGSSTDAGDTTPRTVEVADNSSAALGLAGLAAGLIALVVGLIALTRTRKA